MLTSGVLGSVAAPSGTVVGTTDTQTLTNKTLSNPKVVSTIKDTNNNTILNLSGQASAVNNFVIKNRAAGGVPSLETEGDDVDIWMTLAPKGNSGVRVYQNTSGQPAKLSSSGIDVDVDFNISTQGAGIVRTNGVEVATTSGAQALTNKTISSDSNTLTGVSRRVAYTQHGGTGVEDGANTWAKICTVSTSTLEYEDVSVLLAFNASTGTGETAIVSAWFRSNSSGADPTVRVEITSAPSQSERISTDSFKVISGGWSTDMELWIKKTNTYGGFDVYELSRRSTNTGITFTYEQDSAWQSAVPTGTVNNVSSNGMKAFGRQIADISSTQTLTNKTLTDPNLTNPKISNVYDPANGLLSFLFSSAPGAVNYLQANANTTTNGPQLFASGSDTNISLDLVPKGTGVVRANYVEVATISGTQTLTNKTLTTPNIDTIKDTTSGADMIRITPEANPVTYFNLYNRKSGSTPIIGVGGSDTDISINLLPKGAGVVQANGIQIADVSSTQTLTNKTLRGAVFVDTNGNTAFDVVPTASAVNYVRFLNAATSGTPKVTAAGTDTNINISIEPKGSGKFQIYTTAGNVPTIQAQGADTNVDLNLRTKGTGTIQSWQESGNAGWDINGADTNVGFNFELQGTGTLQENGVDVVTTTGTQTLTNKTLTNARVNQLLDTNGSTALGVSAISSAVNHFYLTNQSTGNYPTFGVDGSDANIGFTLAPKGNGPVRIYTTTGNTPTIDVAGPDTNMDLNLVSKGAGTIQANGVPVATTYVQDPLWVPSDRVEPLPAILCDEYDIIDVDGGLTMTLFTVSRDFTVSNILTMSNPTGSVQSGATSCKVGIYIVNSLAGWPPDIECIARSATKADRWSGHVLDVAPIVDDGAASPSSISSVDLVAGQMYAVVFHSKDHTGETRIRGKLATLPSGYEPYRGFTGGGEHSDLPPDMDIDGAWELTWFVPWFALT